MVANSLRLNSGFAVPDAELAEVMLNTGAATKREAVVTAITEYNRRRAMERLVADLGTFDSVVGLPELLRLREGS
jgi:hypothetical protein